MTKTISDHINDNKDELNNGNISPQRKRHLESELKDLETYKESHPNDEHDPTPLELYCNTNPDALECRVYED